MSAIQSRPGKVVRGEELFGPGHLVETWDIGHDSYSGFPPGIANHNDYEALVIGRTIRSLYCREPYTILVAGQNPLVEKVILLMSERLSEMPKTIIRFSSFYGEKSLYDNKAGYKFDCPKNYEQLWYLLRYLGEKFSDAPFPHEIMIELAIESFNKDILTAKPNQWQPILVI